MIAIAGAKGGCGKTTTTLGLAKAFAEVGEPVIAVDADSQLPNLHVVADVDREPTIADLESGVPISAVAKRPPETSSVAVLTAPSASSGVDIESTLARLRTESVRVLVDCPSGAGPDVVEPILAADSVVVVSTGTERSLQAAETTIELARRIGVPVAGAILVRCEGVPEGFETRLGVPILGVVPECDAPLASDATRAAYAEAVTALEETTPTVPSSTDARPDRLETGTEAIDRLLDGGVPPGSIVALEASPAGPADHVLANFTATRGSLHVSTQRSETVVRHALEAAAVDCGRPTIRHVADGSLEAARPLVDALPDGANLVIDVADDFERADRSSYASFLNAVKERLLETGGVALFSCSSGSHEPEHRFVTRHHADVVVSLETIHRDRERAVDHVVSVSKRRGERPPAESRSLW